MIRSDFHMHTVFCDGADTPEDMILAAIDKGLETVGLSGHSYVSCEKGFCMDMQKTAAYRRTVEELKLKYKNKIRVCCGVEQDIYSSLPRIPYDYSIGSVHFVKYGDGFYPIDWTSDRFVAAAEALFGGDLVSYAAYYFSIVAGVYDKTKCNIIGHFDLASKFNEGGRLFDTEDPRYIAAWKAAADRIVSGMKADGRTPLFEVNTGAISRGYRSEPYPSTKIMEYLRDKGAKFVLSSDAHRKENIAFGFEKWYEKLTGEGFEIISFDPLL